MKIKSLSILASTVLAVGLGAVSPPSAQAADDLRLLNLAPPGGTVPGVTTGPMGPGNSVQATLGYRLESGVKGKIGVYTAGVPGNPSHTGVEIPVFVRKGKGKVQTRFSVKCTKNSPPATPIVKLRYVLFEVNSGGGIVRTLVEKFKSVNYKFLCRQRPTGQPPGRKPDLIVRISGPPTANAGQNIGPAIGVKARNIGGGPAPGTTGTLDPAHGYMIDVMLSTDTSVPAGYATFSPNYSEDVLLQGGRISNTADLAPGATKAYSTGGGIPADTPTGAYYLCARIDSGNKVAEFNEGNNVSCTRIKIKGKRQPTGRKPDLVIKAFGLRKWGKCAPRQVIFTFQVTVKNVGTAASPGIPGMALVQARDQHGGINWGQGVPLGPIPPGGSRTVMIPVAYLMGNPAHVTAASPHPFKAIADPLNLVPELNEGNNESGVINVDPRGICRQQRPRHLQPPPRPRKR